MAQISIHASLAGSDPSSLVDANVQGVFQSTLPLRGATIINFCLQSDCEDFNPRFPCGERRLFVSPVNSYFIFQSTLPLRGATCTIISVFSSSLHFNPRFPCGERHPRRGDHRRQRHFNPRFPCGERPSRSGGRRTDNRISIHASLAGSDETRIRSDICHLPFQSTLPLRGATTSAGCGGTRRRFQSTLPLRGATADEFIECTDDDISIHASLAGSDDCPDDGNTSSCNFNPRFPCGERHFHRRISTPRDNFNPRSPCGERPSRASKMSFCKPFQSTLPLRGATTLSDRIAALESISIHAPLAGSDSLALIAGSTLALFQSTLPLRGATLAALIVDRAGHFNPRSPCGERQHHRDRAQRHGISIHAPLAGSDRSRVRSRRTCRYFNPRSPCGERRVRRFNSPAHLLFQSTLPLRGATSTIWRCQSVTAHFNPRSPCGERPFRARRRALRRKFQSTLPLRGATIGHDVVDFPRAISIHAPLAGSDHVSRLGHIDAGNFNPRSPCGERR